MTPLTSKRYERSYEEEDKNEYENFLVLPEIKQNVSKVNASRLSEKTNERLSESNNFTELPPIDR